MLAILGGLSGVGTLLSGVASGVLAPILGYYTSKDNINLKGFTAGAQVDAQVQIAYIQAQTQMAQIQASQNNWWGARLIVLALASFVTIHFGAVVLDSMPLYGHVVGSWAIAKLPAPLDAWEGKIILSFFIIIPAAPMFSAVTSWLHRK